MTDTEVAVTEETVNKIRPFLAGLPAYLQGAILADLLSLWLAGHHVEGDGQATAQLRSNLLESHLSLVKQMIPENARLLGTAV
jgi:hypothetical protein